MRGVRIILLGAVLTVAAACSSDSSEPAGSAQPTGGDTTSESEPGGEAGSLTIVDFAFEPSEVTAGDGGVLTIANQGSATHTFTMDDGSIDEEIAPGDSVEVTVDTPGAFHCEIHPSMTGEVTG